MNNLQIATHAMRVYEYHTVTRWEQIRNRRIINRQLDDILGQGHTFGISLIVSLSIILSVIFLGVVSVNAETLYICVNKDSYLNGRAEPSKNSEVTMKLYSDDIVELVRVDGEWAEIVGGETGTSFVNIRYVSSTLEPYPATNNSDGRVNVRKTIGGKVTGYIKKGETVTISQTIDGWGYTGDGWVSLSCFDY